MSLVHFTNAFIFLKNDMHLCFQRHLLHCLKILSEDHVKKSIYYVYYYKTKLWLCVCMLSHFSRVRLFATPWTIAHQPPLSMEFSRQEYWSGFPCPPPSGDLPNPQIEPACLMSPTLAGGFFITSAIQEARVTWEAPNDHWRQKITMTSYSFSWNNKPIKIWRW